MSTSGDLGHIEALIDGGGQIMLGTLAPVKGTAVAHDGAKTLAMLRRRPGEAVNELMARLNDAIAEAKATGQRIDEINKAAASQSYEVVNPTSRRGVNTSRS